MACILQVESGCEKTFQFPGGLGLPAEPDRILVVDSDAGTAGEIVRLLAAPGRVVVSCGDAAGAIQAIKGARFDCAIVDVKLPDMPGYEAVPIMREVEPSLCVIMTAAENTRELEMQARRQDIIYYYIKSFDLKELETAVNAALEKARRAREMVR